MSFNAGDNTGDILGITFWASDEFPSYRVDGGGKHELYTLPVKIGGRDGYLHEDNPTTAAAIKVAPGVTVTFSFSGPRSGNGSVASPPSSRIEDVLRNVVWAPDVSDESTWPAVADWT